MLKCSYSFESSNECWWLTRAFATYLKKKRKNDLKKCIICQNSKDKKEDNKLTNTKAGTNVITEASKSLKDSFLHGLKDAVITNIKYQVNPCYATLELKKSIDTSNSATLFAYTGIHNVVCSRAKRAKTVGHQISHVKNSIIYHQNKCREES